MSRFETKFAELAAKKEGALVTFVTLCDPTFDRSFELSLHVSRKWRRCFRTRLSIF